MKIPTSVFQGTLMGSSSIRLERFMHSQIVEFRNEPIVNQKNVSKSTIFWIVRWWQKYICPFEIFVNVSFRMKVLKTVNLKKKEEMQNNICLSLKLNLSLLTIWWAM